MLASAPLVSGTCSENSTIVTLRADFIARRERKQILCCAQDDV
jgi:hypothetical protein